MNILKDILYHVALKSVQGSTDKSINSLQYDSRKISVNDVFVAIKGAQSDGHSFIDKAIENGACVIVAETIPQEKAEHEKLGESDYSLDWFKSLTPEEKSKYIGRGHELSHPQFDYIYDNNFILLL